MEWAGQVSRTVGLVGQPGKMINLISEKISDHMESSRSAFTIHVIVSQVGQPIKRDRMLFRAYTYLGISQKKYKHGSNNHAKV